MLLYLGCIRKCSSSKRLLNFEKLFVLPAFTGIKLNYIVYIHLHDIELTQKDRVFL